MNEIDMRETGSMPTTWTFSFPAVLWEISQFLAFSRIRKIFDCLISLNLFTWKSWWKSKMYLDICRDSLSVASKIHNVFFYCHKTQNKLKISNTVILERYGILTNDITITAQQITNNMLYLNQSFVYISNKNNQFLISSFKPILLKFRDCKDCWIIDIFEKNKSISLVSRIKGWINNWRQFFGI